MRGLRDFRNGRATAHGGAFEVWLCSVGQDILWLRAKIEEYFDQMAEQAG